MNMSENLNLLRDHEVFFEIDFQFADYILELESPDQYQEQLYLACLLLSFYANRQHSLLPLKLIRGKMCSEVCRRELDSDFTIDLSPDMDWAKLFPITIGSEGDHKPIIFSFNSLYLNKYFLAEQAVVKFIQGKREVATLDESVRVKINELFEPKPGWEIHQPNWQKVAAFLALRSHFCVISGGPGTGKTTTVGRILALLLLQNPTLKIDLVAPTGKASDRLGESIKATKVELANYFSRDHLSKIPEMASTIHRYLHYHGGDKTFAYHAERRTLSDVLLIDECSMVDLPLFKHLLEALKPNCRVLLLGDKDQLTAVETGNVLGELTTSKSMNTFSNEFCEAYSELTSEGFDYRNTSPSILTDCTVKLEHSYRFKANQGVGQLAQLINQCDHSEDKEKFQGLFNQFDDIQRYPLSNSFMLNGKGDFGFFNGYVEKCSLFLKYSSDEVAIDLLEYLKEYRILSALKTGRYGVDRVNELVSQNVFKREDPSLYHGRCIMIQENNRHLQVFNGDVGLILHKDGKPLVYFLDQDHGIKTYNPTVLPEFKTAFAMTVHKSQGSEFKNISFILPKGKAEYLSKELIYTAVTRAKEQVHIYASLDDLYDVSIRKTQRFSGIAEKLRFIAK